MMTIQTTTAPMPGMFLGGGSSCSGQQIFDQINQACQGQNTFFGSAADPLRDQHQQFIKAFVRPTIQVMEELQKPVAKIVDDDYIRPLLVVDDFFDVPPSMQVPILNLAPARELFDEGRIDGFGYNPEEVPFDESYERLAMNGVISRTLNPDEEYMVWETSSLDPKLTPDEEMALYQTRCSIEEILERTLLDPTDPENTIG